MSWPGAARAASLAVLVLLAVCEGGRVAARQVLLDTERRPGPVVDFTALQADGTPVADLQASEVEIRIGGRARTLRALKRVTAAPLTDAVPGLPSPFGTNADVAAGRRFALVIDEESFVAGHEPLLRNAVEGLLGGFTPADQASLVVLPYRGVTVPFTSDTARLRRAMSGLLGQGRRDESGSDLACRTRRLLDALDGFLREQPAPHSPLTVLLFTAGLAAPRRDAPMALGPGMCELLVNHFDAIKEATGVARAGFYLVMPDDVGMGGERWRESIAGGSFLGSNNPLEGIEHFEGSTGAERVPLDGTGTRALLRVARETSVSYEAELEPEPGRDEADGLSRTLEVRVRRAGVDVRARPAVVFARRPPTGPSPRLGISDVLLSGAAYTDVPMRIDGFTVRQPDGRLRLGIVVEPAAPGVTFASVAAALVDADRRVVAQWFASDPGERPLLGAMVAAAGSYRLRVVAADAAGRFGAAERGVGVGLTRVGPVALGSLVLGVSRERGTEPRLLFGAEPTVIASFDLYGGAPGMQISAALEVARSVDGPAMVSLPLTLTRAGDGRVVAAGAVPLGALPPGDYAVRGIVRLEDGTTGRVTCTLRKAPR
jgi:hypothetical protein